MISEPLDLDGELDEEDLESSAIADAQAIFGDEELGTTDKAFEEVEDVLLGVICGILKDRPHMTTTYAVEHVIKRVMPKPIPGPYRSRNNPLNRVLQDTLTDDRVRDTTIVGGAQTGKTVVLMNMLIMIMLILGGAVMLTYTSEGSARKKVDEDVEPMFRSCKMALEMIVEKAAGESKRNRKLYWASLIAALNIAWTQSNSGTKSASVKYVLNDEVDRAEIQAWGDPYSGIRMRQTKYEDEHPKTVNASTVEGSEETSIIWSMFLDGDQSEPFCDCPSCGHTHIPDWEQVSINKDANGRILRTGHYYGCPSCGFRMSDPVRFDMIKSTLRWRQLAAWDCPCGNHVDPKNDHDAAWVMDPVGDELSLCNSCGKNQLDVNSHRSFRMNILHAIHPLDKVVDEFRMAQGKPAKLKTFWNERFNRFFTIGDKADGAKTVRDRLTVPYGNQFGLIASVRPEDAHLNGRPVEVPGFVKSLVASCDPGMDRLEVTIGGYGDGMRYAGVDHVRLHGPINDPRTWAQLEKLRNRLFHGPNGTLYQIDALLVDTGFMPEYVTKYTRPREMAGVFPIRGTDVGEIFQTKKFEKVKFPHYPVGKLAGLGVMLSAQRAPNRDPEKQMPNGRPFAPYSMVFPAATLDRTTGQVLHEPFDETFWRQYTNAKIEEHWTQMKGVHGKESKVDSSVRLEAADTGVYQYAAIEHVMRAKGFDRIEDMPFQCARFRSSDAKEVAKPAPKRPATAAQIAKDDKVLSQAMIAKKAAPVLPKPQFKYRGSSDGRSAPRTRVMR